MCFILFIFADSCHLFKQIPLLKEKKQNANRTGLNLHVLSNCIIYVELILKIGLILILIIIFEKQRYSLKLMAPKTDLLRDKTTEHWHPYITLLTSVTSHISFQHFITTTVTMYYYSNN